MDLKKELINEIPGTPRGWYRKSIYWTANG
jgi:hypothetical protein